MGDSNSNEVGTSGGAENPVSQVKAEIAAIASGLTGGSLRATDRVFNPIAQPMGLDKTENAMISCCSEGHNYVNFQDPNRAITISHPDPRFGEGAKIVNPKILVNQGEPVGVA
jgi:hypothetical protein